MTGISWLLITTCVGWMTTQSRVQFYCLIQRLLIQNLRTKNCLKTGICRFRSHQWAQTSFPKLISANNSMLSTGTTDSLDGLMIRLRPTGESTLKMCHPTITLLKSTGIHHQSMLLQIKAMAHQFTLPPRHTLCIWIPVQILWEYPSSASSSTFLRMPKMMRERMNL